MPKLVPILPKNFIKILQKKGYFVDHQTGSHVILYKNNHSVPLVVPKHNKQLKIGLLRGILRQTEISLEEYERLRLGK